MKALSNIARIVVTAVLAGASVGAAAAWPDKPIKIVVPFPPGGNTDALGRLVANHLTTTLGQTVIVDNKPGAGSMIGSQAVARSAPDGYTFLIGSIANAMNHFFYKKPMVDITKELVPVAQLVAVPNYVAINNNFPARTIPEIVAYAKANPEKMSCATSGIGTSPYMSCILLQKLAGVKIISVPYKGGAAAMQDTIGGQAQMVIANEALPFIQDKRLTGVAVTTATRSPLAPDLPAIAESVPGFDVTSWYGIFAPTGTPQPIIDRINAEVATMLKSPEVRKRLDAIGATPVTKTQKEFTSYVNAEMKRWEDIIKPLNISLD